MRVPQPIPQADLEKKRWPPISMRLPLYSTDCDSPPTTRVASSTVTSRTPASASSQAAVSPAGPAPMMSTRVRRISTPGFAILISREQEQLARAEIEAEHDSGGCGLRHPVGKIQELHANRDDRLVERESGEPPRGKQHEFRARILQPALVESPANAQGVGQCHSEREADGRCDPVVQSRQPVQAD